MKKGFEIRMVVFIDLAVPLEEIGRSELREHIRDSIRATGDRDPENDPLFGAIETVRIGRIEIVR